MQKPLYTACNIHVNRDSYDLQMEMPVNICDPFWEKMPIRTDNFFSDLLINWCIIRRYTRCGFDDIAT